MNSNATTVAHRAPTQAAWAALALLPKCAFCWLAWGAAGVELCGAPAATASWRDGWMLPIALSAIAILLTQRCHAAAYHRGPLCSR